MSENPDLNKGFLGETKDDLQHVETNTGRSTAKTIFKCVECGELMDIPDDILMKMENDEPFTAPNHHGKPIGISVQG